MISYLVAIGIIVLVYCLLALGLNLQWGHTGLINFGHVAFFALGAYTSTLTTMQLGVPIGVGVLLGIAVAALAAYPIGWLTIRLREDYLAIATLGFSELVRLVLMNEEWLTKGPSGIPNVPRPFVSLGTGPAEWAMFALLLVAVVVTYWLVDRLVKSPFGRTLRAIREDDQAAAALAKDVVAFKVRSLIIGAAIAGLAGGLYAHYIQYVVPDQFTPGVTFYVWMAVILGGSGSNLGSIVGTIILMVFMEGTRFLKDIEFFYTWSDTRLAALRFMVIGLGLVLLVLYKPEGLFGDRPKKGGARSAAGGGN